MFEFEKHNKIKPEVPKDEPDKTTILQKIRNHSTNFVAPFLAGASIGPAAYHIIENQNELKTQSDKADAYLIRGDQVASENKSELINDSFICDVALSNKNDEKTQFFIRMLALCNNILDNGYAEGENLSININEKLDYERQLNEMKSKLKPEEKAAAKEKILEIISLIKVVKADLAEHVKSDDYLNKLAMEMNISTKAAKEHQKVRLQNINNLNFNFKNSSEIDMAMGHFSYAYYSHNNNAIYLPYDINLKKKTEKDFFIETLRHEILHGITKSGLGLSKKVRMIFKQSFMPENKDEDQKYINYYSDVAELIVRKQLLDQWMQNNNFKKYNEEFTTEHYKKLLVLKNEEKLPEDVVELINHIKPESFVNMMNELAALEKDNKDYYHPGWDYKENQA